MNTAENTYVKVEIGEATYAQLKGQVQELYGKPVIELSFDEAAIVVSALLRNMDFGLLFNDDGKVIIDSNEDGESTFLQAAKVASEKILPEIDDQGEIVIEVFGKLGFRDVLRKRPPQVVERHIFKNPPLSLI